MTLNKISYHCSWTLDLVSPWRVCTDTTWGYCLNTWSACWCFYQRMRSQSEEHCRGHTRWSSHHHDISHSDTTPLEHDCDHLLLQHCLESNPDTCQSSCKLLNKDQWVKLKVEGKWENQSVEVSAALNLKLCSWTKISIFHLDNLVCHILDQSWLFLPGTSDHPPPLPEVPPSLRSTRLWCSHNSWFQHKTVWTALLRDDCRLGNTYSPPTLATQL